MNSSDLRRRETSRTASAMRAMESSTHAPHRQPELKFKAARPGFETGFSSPDNRSFQTSFALSESSAAGDAPSIAATSAARSLVKSCGVPPPVYTTAARSPGPSSCTAARAISRAFNIG